MRARITTSASVLDQVLSCNQNDHQCTELVVIHARMSDLLLVKSNLSFSIHFFHRVQASSSFYPHCFRGSAGSSKFKRSLAT